MSSLAWVKLCWLLASRSREITHEASAGGYPPYAVAVVAGLRSDRLAGAVAQARGAHAFVPALRHRYHSLSRAAQSRYGSGRHQDRRPDRRSAQCDAWESD